MKLISLIGNSIFLPFIAKPILSPYKFAFARSDVKVDSVPVAKLDVRMSLIPGSGKLDYKINYPLTNITEFYSKGFNITIPPDTHKPNYAAGTWRAEREECIQKINVLYEAGVMRLHFWPISDFEEQIEIFRKEIASHY